MISSDSPVVVNNKSEVIKVLKDNLDNFKKFGVTEVGLFGSFVRNEATKSSDVDLLVTLTNHDYFNFCRLIDFANSLFAERTVDVLSEGGINEINGIYICREVEYVN